MSNRWIVEQYPTTVIQGTASEGFTMPRPEWIVPHPTVRIPVVPPDEGHGMPMPRMLLDGRGDADTERLPDLRDGAVVFVGVNDLGAVVYEVARWG